jgi:hypothetical protein
VMQDYRQASRKTLIIDRKIKCHKKGSRFYNQHFDGKRKFGNKSDQIEETDEILVVHNEVRHGLKPSYTSTKHFYDEKSMYEWIARYPVGTEIDDSKYPFLFDFAEELSPELEYFLSLNIAKTYSPLAAETLKKAGLLSDLHRPTDEIIHFLGKEKLDEIHSMHGENWSVMAVMLFCLSNLSKSSAAFLAAIYKYHYYISGDEYTAGYFLRDLEIAIEGVEASAIKALETRKKAGASGSAKSRKARESRRLSLFLEIEDVAKGNPDILKLGEAALAKVALNRLRDKEPRVWSQGAGQISEYLGDIRRGEAGPELQARYVALFGDKPPKRLHGFRGTA